MAEPSCRHGVRMDRSCLKCGRFIDVRGPDYLAKEANFTRSIQDLEAILEPLLAEVAKAQAEVDEMEAGQAKVGTSLPTDRSEGNQSGSNQKAQEPPEDPRLWFKR